MSTSGSYDFTRTAGQVVTASLRKLGLVAEGETPSAQQMTDGLEDLNLLIKSWPARGINLWRYEELTVFTDTTSQSYNIGATGDKASFNAYKTEVATAASSGASTITVDSDDNILDGDVIGIELDDGTLQWTTVNGTPAANVVTLTATLTDDVAIDNHVYNYTSIAQRPMRLYNGRLKNADDTETPLVSISRKEYMELPTKNSSGVPVQYHYNPLLDNGKLYIWPISSNVKFRLLFSAQRQLQDVDNTTDNLDFPQEWLRAIIYNLARDMGFDYNIEDTNPRKFAAIEKMAIELLQEVEDSDVETGSITFMPVSDDLEGDD